MSRHMRNAATVLFFGLTSLIFVQGAPFTGDTVGGVDITTQQTTPFLEEHETFDRARVPLQVDQHDGIALAATFWREIQEGNLRMWEPNLGTGAPLGGVVYTRVWSPFYWVGAVVPAHVLPSYAVWFALWTAQTGAWALARRIGIGPMGAAFAGVAYGFSGSVTALLLRINEAALAPWVLLAVHAVVSGGGRKPRVALLGLSIAVGMTWLGGFPAGTIFVLYGAGVVAIAMTLREAGRDLAETARRLSLALAGVVLGTALVAPVLLPSYEFLDQSESLVRSYDSDHAAGLEMFATAVSGRILGTYPEGTWWWPDRGYSNPVAASATVGVSALALLAVGGLSRRWLRDSDAIRTIGRVYLPLGAFVFLGTFVGGPVLAGLQLLPFLGNNEFGRSRFLLALAIALAAGCVLDGLVDRREPNQSDAGRPERRDPWFRGFSLAVVAAALVGAGLVTARAVALDRLAVTDTEAPALAAYRVERLLDGLLVPGAALAVAVIVLALLARARLNPRYATVLAGLLVVVVAAELQWGAWGFTPVVDADEGFFPDHESFSVMQPEVSDGMWRFAGTSLNVIRPNTAAWLEMADLRISNPSHERYRELMRAVDADVFDRARLRTWFTDDLDPSSEGLDRSAVRYLVAPAAHGVLEALPAEVVKPDGSALAISDGTEPVRGLRFRLDRRRCVEGFLTVRHGDEVVGRRPLWQLDGLPFDVALEDVRGPAELSVETDGCDVAVAGAVTVMRAAPGTELTALWADDAVVYERGEPRPRVEVATSVVGITDPQARLDALTDGRNLDVVILDEPIARQESAGGTAAILADSGDALRIAVDTTEAGYLIVRDALAPGWRATVDGSSVRMIHADHAYRAVPVPAGESIVQMTYFPRSRMIGLAAAGVALAVLGLVAGLAVRRGLGSSVNETGTAGTSTLPVSDR